MTHTEQLLAMSGITKTFGHVVALRDADITLSRGEVHAIVGENGAGKSTLMRVLAGHYAADAGSMILLHKNTDIVRPHPGERTSIGFVEQEGGLVLELTGAENLLLQERASIVCKRHQVGGRLTSLAARFGIEIDPHVPVGSLTMGQRQRLEIMITLARGAEVLILDEPTASLSLEDAATLARIIRRFVTEGGGVFYISHKLREVIDVSDEITVMRKGHIVGCHKGKETTVATLAAEMIGELPGAKAASAESSKQYLDMIETISGKGRHSHHAAATGVACDLISISAKSRYQSESDLKNLNLTIRQGEVVGVAGVVGSGQTTLAEVLAGLIKPDAGTLERRSGAVGYVPENRHRDALAVSLSVRENFSVHMHRREAYAKGVWPRKKELDAAISELLAKARVHGATLAGAISGLSGGNQQKVVVAREMEQAPVILVAHNPFRGLDVKAIQDVRHAMEEACSVGCGVIMISSDLDELFQVAHRIVVMFDGHVIGEVSIEDADIEALGRMMGGAMHGTVN